MGSIFITDFKFGLDRRRQRVAGVPGTLWNAKNVVISRGGEIERPKRFVPTYVLPAGQTFGLGTVHGQVFTFGSVTSPGVPLGVQYQQLSAPSGARMTQVLDVKSAAGGLYVIARYADGGIFHFYNGARITDWDALGDANCDYSSLVAYFAEIVTADPAVGAVPFSNILTLTALVAGTPFTVLKSTTNGGSASDQDITLTTVQANVPASAEVRATTAISFNAGTTGTITDILINSVSTMQAPVVYTTDNATTLALVAVQINNKTTTHGYTAALASGTLTIRAAAGTGATPNEYPVAATLSGDLVLQTPSMSGGAAVVAGVAQIVTAAFIGTFEAADKFVLTINGVDYAATGRTSGTGVSAYVNKRRVFSPAATLLEYCKVNTFTDWHTSDPATGAGFINISNDAEGSERLIGAGTFINQTAVFSRRNVRLYAQSADATAIVLTQPVDNTGSLAGRSILSFGTTDLIYLDETGIRSLKARDASGAAFVNDLGIALDTFVRDHIDTLPSSTVQRACAIVEPRDGRYWLALDGRVYVLSYFPGSQISAWTYFEPGFAITDFARSYQQLYARAGDTIYLYGGANGSTYPNAGEMIAEVDLPFVASSPPARHMMTGFDIAAEGPWVVTALLDPDNEAQAITIGTFNGITYGFADNGFGGRTTHVALTLTCAAAGAAKISNITMYTDGREPND